MHYVNLQCCTQLMLKSSLIKTVVKYLHLANMAYHLRTQKIDSGCKIANDLSLLFL